MSALPMVVLEVIVTSVREARIAAEAGADRLELVADFARGGLTPDLHIAAAVCAAVAIPVNVMLRPHDRDFVYSADERRAFVATARSIADAGAHAVVFGALDSAGDIDADLIVEVASAANLPLTFHRAFDESRDARAAYSRLRRLPSVTHLLTSGHAPNVEQGRDLLSELANLQTAPIVLAGGGVTRDNLAMIVATGVREMHVGSAARTAGAIDGAKIRELVTIARMIR